MYGPPAEPYSDAGNKFVHKSSVENSNGGLSRGR